MKEYTIMISGGCHPAPIKWETDSYGWALDTYIDKCMRCANMQALVANMPNAIITLSQRHPSDTHIVPQTVVLRRMIINNH